MGCFVFVATRAVLTPTFFLSTYDSERVFCYKCLVTHVVVRYDEAKCLATHEVVSGNQLKCLSDSILKLAFFIA
jgi:hypothetical protein